MILIIGIVVDLLFNPVNARIRRRWGVAPDSAGPFLAVFFWCGGEPPPPRSGREPAQPATRSAPV